MRCLLIQTNDNRQFFTYEKNFEQLTEFSKTFDAAISVVKIKEGPVLELEELAPAICNALYQFPEVQYEKVTRRKSEIDDYIKNCKKPITIKELKKKFANLQLSDAALYYHLRKAKKEFNA